MMITQTRLMGWESPIASAERPDFVTHITGPRKFAVCGAWVRTVGPEWPVCRADWPGGIRRCAACELVLFGGLRY
jgi:hypothetical protein